ncbi:MAG: MFS transporter [Caldilineaceae bacterium]
MLDRLPVHRLRQLSSHLELILVGVLPPLVRRNMYIELVGSLAYGVLYTSGIAFVPVVLRRTGASETMLAIYVASQFIGSLLSSLSIPLMQRWKTKPVVLTCWFLSRASFALWAFIVNPLWMLAVGAFFWTLEPFTGPGYTRILQLIYPTEVRGKVMGVVRVGRGMLMLLLAPLAGWALDQWGYRSLFPIAAAMGIVSTLTFSRVQFKEEELSQQQGRNAPRLDQILRTDRRYTFFLITFTIFGIGTLLSWTIYPLVQVDRLHLSYSQLGWLEMVSSLFWLLGFILFGQIVDRYGGITALQVTTAIAIVIPTTYIFARNGWMLIPAYVAQGLVNAGFDLGPISAVLQLAKPNQVMEYAALQSTMIGLRGIVIPLVSVGLLHIGVPFSGVFGLSVFFMVVALTMFRRVQKLTR